MPGWPDGQFRLITTIGISLIVLCTLIIYWQTVRVPPIDYEDPFYLVHSPYVGVAAPFSGLSSVWTEPYFANFHPVTTTTWLVDRALADKSKPFDGRPFRIAHLIYAVLGASLLIPLYRHLGLPTILAPLGALIFAVHPIHTEVVAWLSARKDLVSLIFILSSFLAWGWAIKASTASQWRLRHTVTVFLVLTAVLSKPIAVILPALFAAYEFCSAPHAGITSWRWFERQRHAILTRVLALTVIFLFVGGVSAAIFRALLARDAMYGGWLIFVPITSLLLLGVAPSTKQLVEFCGGSTPGIRVLGPPFVILSLVFGAGSAWTFWAQQQAGAIKGGLSLLPTLNLTFDALLLYTGKALIPAYMSASYTWSEFPYVSVRGMLGAALVFVALWTGMRLAGSLDRNRRLIAFGIFWYLIAFIPVSNMIPTSTKMADRYLLVPTVGAVLSLLALATLVVRHKQFVVYGALMLLVTLYTAWSYERTEVWCGKTMQWNGRPQPDLSLWTAAVETDPENDIALNSLGLAYLRLTPPEADKGLVYLNRALQSGENRQSKIAGDSRLILTAVYEGLGDGYLLQASQLNAERFGSDIWQKKKEGYAIAVKYFGLASKAPSGFASSDARVLSRFAEASEGQARMDVEELSLVAPEQRERLISERNELRNSSEESMRYARTILAAGNVSSSDPNYRAVMMGQGNIIFGREVGASNEEKIEYYREALVHYQEAAALLPDDPRPLLYQGLCYERLTGAAKSLEERREQFAFGEAVLRKALALNVDAPDYNPAVPYRVLASLYTHMNDFQSALDSLKRAKQAETSQGSTAASSQLASDIEKIEQFLAEQKKKH
jgi:tetratricopeptide (TPR) repeat protein